MEIALNWYKQFTDRRGKVEFEPGTRQDHSGVSFDTLDQEIACKALTVLGIPEYSIKLSSTGKSLVAKKIGFVANDVVTIDDAPAKA
jgi:hypothetical protein